MFVRITGLEPVRIAAAIFKTATYTYFAISAGYCTKCGGGTWIRTPDILLAKQTLYLTELYPHVLHIWWRRRESNPYLRLMRPMS